MSPWRKGTAFLARTRCFPITRANRATTRPAEAKSHPCTLPPQAPQRAEPLHGMRHWFCQIKTRHMWKPWRWEKHTLDCQLPTAHNLFNQTQRYTGSTCKMFLKKKISLPEQQAVRKLKLLHLFSMCSYAPSALTSLPGSSQHENYTITHQTQTLHALSIFSGKLKERKVSLIQCHSLPKNVKALGFETPR